MPKRKTERRAVEHDSGSGFRNLLAEVLQKANQRQEWQTDPEHVHFSKNILEYMP